MLMARRSPFGERRGALLVCCVDWAWRRRRWWMASVELQCQSKRKKDVEIESFGSRCKIFMHAWTARAKLARFPGCFTFTKTCARSGDHFRSGDMGLQVTSLCLS